MRRRRIGRALFPSPEPCCLHACNYSSHHLIGRVFCVYFIPSGRNRNRKFNQFSATISSSGLVFVSSFLRESFAPSSDRIIMIVAHVQPPGPISAHLFCSSQNPTESCTESTQIPPDNPKRNWKLFKHPLIGRGMGRSHCFHATDHNPTGRVSVTSINHFVCLHENRTR